MGRPPKGDTDVRPQTLRAQAARQAIAERFLAAVNDNPPPTADGPLAFPAFLSLTSIRTASDGSINLSLNVPSEHVHEMLLPAMAYCGRPLAVTIEVIDVDGIDVL